MNEALLKIYEDNTNEFQGYEDLSKEIQNTIKEQDEMYRDIQKISPQQNQEYKLEGKIENLKERRDNIFNYLNNNYNKNTELRKHYFDKLYENKKKIKNQEAKIKYLKDKINEENSIKDTNNRNINFEKYKNDEFNYYYYLYLVIFIIQLILLSVLISNSVRFFFCWFLDYLGKQV